MLSKGSILFWIDRPILLHGRNTTGEVCDCGCNSPEGIVTRRIPHISMILEKTTGARVFRTRENAEWFDEFITRPEVERIYMPHRCTPPQYAVVRDMRAQLRLGKMRKACIMFGGNRSGKTTENMELEADVWCFKGGPGRVLMNVAPTLEKNTITLKKLVLGDATDRTVVPIIDPRLVMHSPRNGEIERDGQAVSLIDGTKIVFRHGNASGGNQKGVSAQSVFLDEPCEIRKIENWHVLLNRTMESQGCVFGSTTPVQGHWLKEEVYNKGVELDKAGPEDEVVWTHLSCFENVFVSRRQIERVIASLNDDRLVRREVYGEWVPEGLTLYEYWDGRDMAHGGMTFDGPWEPEAHGYINITDRAIGHAFKRVKASRTDHMVGVDFNVKPMSLADFEVVVKAGQDEDNPANWCFWFTQEVVRDGSLLSFVDHLERVAHRDLDLDEDWFHQILASCDATGAQRNNEAATRHGISTLSSSLVDFMRTKGHDARPCNLSNHGNPANPDQTKCYSLIHKLMRDGRIFAHRTRCKRLIHGWEALEQTSDGRVHKEPGKFTDKLSGPPDAARYGIWPFRYAVAPELFPRIKYAA